MKYKKVDYCHTILDLVEQEVLTEVEVLSLLCSNEVLLREEVGVFIISVLLFRIRRYYILKELEEQ